MLASFRTNYNRQSVNRYTPNTNSLSSTSVLEKKAQVENVLTSSQNSQYDTSTSNTYIVQKGDNLTTIAKRYGISVDTLYQDNKELIGDNPNRIFVGQELLIRDTSLSSEPQEIVVEEEVSTTEVQSEIEAEVVTIEKNETTTVTASALTGEPLTYTELLEKYTGNVHTKKQATASAKASSGIITMNNQVYVIVSDSDYQKIPGTISESDYHLMIAQVAGEAANDTDDMLGVVTTMLNRLESSGNYGDSITEVLEKGYFPWGKSYQSYVAGGKYFNTTAGQEKLAKVTSVVNDALGGVRNLASNVYYYSGDNVHNYFSDVL